MTARAVTRNTVRGVFRHTKRPLLPIAAGINPSLFLDFERNRYAVNTINKAFSDIITFTRASTGTYLDVNRDLQVAAIDEPRFTHDTGRRGLLIEAQSTNTITNSTMVGADDSPSTLPSNYAVETSAGLTTTVVGVGTERGMEFIDLRLNGTSSGTNYQFRFGFGTNSVQGEFYCSSAFIKKVGGTDTNVNNVNVRVREVGGSFGSQSSPNVDLETIVLERYEAFREMADAGDLKAQWLITMSISNTSAIDITLRIAATQLEEGKFASSVIPTTTAAVTRSKDVPVITGANFSDWYNASEGSFIPEFNQFHPATSGSFASILRVSDGTSNEKIDLQQKYSSVGLRFDVIDGGSTQARIDLNQSMGVDLNVGLAYKVNDFARVVDGGSVGVDGAGSIPTVDQLEFGPNKMNGVFYNLSYYNTRLSNAQLQGLTS